MAPPPMPTGPELIRTALLIAGLLWAPSLPADPEPGGAGGILEDESMVAGAEPVIMEASEGYETVVTGSPHPRETSSEFQLRGLPLQVSPRRSGGEMLRLVPGLVVVQHGSEGKAPQFFLRGFDAVHGSDVEVTVDGIPINELSNVHAQGYLDPGFVIPEAVTCLHVLKGPFGIHQGPFATAGSVRYELGIPADRRGVYAGYETGTTNRHRFVASVSPKDPLKRHFLAVEAVRDNEFGGNRAHQRLSVLGRFPMLDTHRTGRLDILVSAYGARFGLPGLVRLDDVEAGFVDFHGALDRSGSGWSDRGTASLRYGLDRATYGLDLLAWGMVRHLELSQNFTGFLEHPEKGDRHRQRHDALSGGVRASGRVHLHPTVSLRVLGGYRLEHLDQDMDLVDTRGVPWLQVRDLSGFQHLAHAGIGLDWTPVPAFRVGAGLRADLMYADVENFVDGIRGSGTVYHLGPRFTLSGTPGGGWALFGSYGRGWRPPEAAAFAAPDSAGDEDTTRRPAQGTSSHVVEAGVHWEWRRILDVGLTGFGVFVLEEQVFNHAEGTAVEVGGTRRLGVEAMLSATPVPWLEVRADLTWVHARITATGEPIPGVPPLSGSVQVSLVHPLGFRLGTRFTALSARPLAYGARGSTMFRWDLTAGYRWRWLDVGFEIDNVLNAKMREGEYNFASHWNPARIPSRIPAVHLAAGSPFVLRGRLSVLY